jgi:hypothetical protein
MQLAKLNKLKKSRFAEVIFPVIIALIPVIILYCAVFLPVKYAVKYSDLDKNTDYVIVNQTPASGVFEIIEDKSGKHDNSMEMIVSGDIPGDEFKNYGIMVGPSGVTNQFVLYGEFTGEKDFYGEKIMLYNVRDWDILYPVKRGNMTSFLYPKNGICRADYIKDWGDEYNQVGAH